MGVVGILVSREKRMGVVGIMDSREKRMGLVGFKRAEDGLGRSQFQERRGWAWSAS